MSRRNNRDAVKIRELKDKVEALKVENKTLRQIGRQHKLSSSKCVKTVCRHIIKALTCCWRRSMPPPTNANYERPGFFGQEKQTTNATPSGRPRPHTAFAGHRPSTRGRSAARTPPRRPYASILSMAVLTVVLLLSDVCMLSGLRLAIQRRRMLAECFSVTKTPRQQIASAPNPWIGSKLCAA